MSPLCRPGGACWRRRSLLRWRSPLEEKELFNWRPVYDIEHETERLRKENKRLAGLNSRMDALLRNE